MVAAFLAAFSSFFKDGEEMDYFFQGIFLILWTICLFIYAVWSIRKT